MAEHAAVTVNLPKARVYRGVAYGPGTVEVSPRVARAFGLESAPKKAARKPGE